MEEPAFLETENNEVVVSQIISVAEKALERYDEPRRFGERENACGLASDLVRRVAERLGASNIRCDNRQLLHVHGVFGTANSRDTSQHALSTLYVGSAVYLVDLSFCQFIDPVTQNIHTDGGKITGNFKDHPLARELVEKGFFLLTDQSLRDYLRMTAIVKDPQRIDSATTDTLLADRTSVIKKYDHPVEWLDKQLGEN